MFFSSMKERITTFIRKDWYIPRAGIAIASPCFLDRSADNCTIRDHHAGNVAVLQLLELINA